MTAGRKCAKPRREGWGHSGHEARKRASVLPVGLAEVGKGKVWVNTSAKEAGRAHLICSPLPAGRVIAVATNARQDRT
jgi:hypothetical protein